VPGASGDRVRVEGFKAGVLVAARQVTA
jgi:hypothetical protein